MKLEVAVAELLAKVTRLERELARVNARNAKPVAIPDGWWLCVLQGALSAQGTATAKLIVWNKDNDDWQYMDPEQTITIQDFWLNDGEEIDSGTRIKAIWYRNVWTWDQAYCAAADNLPAE